MVTTAKKAAAIMAEYVPTEPGDNGHHTLASTGEPGFTDIGNSTRLIDLHGDRLRYVPKWKRWIVWSGHAWQEDPDRTAITELAKDVSSSLYHQAAESTDSDQAKKTGVWAARSATANAIRSLIELARGIPGTPIDPDDLDNDPWLFGVRNGVVDLRTGKHRVGDPDDLMTRQAPVDYDAAAACATWDQCMTDWFPDPATRAYVQRLAGSVLAAKQVDHRLIIHYGEGGNGKGTFVGALSHLLGPYFTVPDKRLIVDTGRSESELLPARAALYRARLAVADETDKRQRLKEASVKNLTGNDMQAGRFLYGNQFSFTPTHSLWLTTNKMPEIRGRDRGIWRRIEVAPWVATFTGTAEDRHLDDKLAEETPGILNWLIEGCLQWQDKGLAPSDQVLAVTAEYRDAEDLLGRFATDNGIAFTEGLWISAQNLRQLLTDWCESEGIRDIPSTRDVATWLERGEATSTRTRRFGEKKQKTWWRDVGISDEDDETLENTTSVHRVQSLHKTSPTPTRRESPVETVHTVHTDAAQRAETVTQQHFAPICPKCGETPKAVYPSGLCRDCDSLEVAP